MIDKVKKCFEDFKNVIFEYCEMFNCCNVEQMIFIWVLEVDFIISVGYMLFCEEKVVDFEDIYNCNFKVLIEFCDKVFDFKVVVFYIKKIN